MAEQELGKVSALWRYPVKSMAGESLRSVRVGRHGLIGDRRWAFIRPDMERSGFPWLTIREVPQLWHYQPYFADAENVESSKTLVKAPDGAEFEIAEPALAARLGEGVRLMKVYSGIFDTLPLSLLSVQSVDGISAACGLPLTPPRFRPNILIDAPDGGPFPEDHWTGSVLRIGAHRLRVDARDHRCMMVNTDPVSLESEPRVLRTIAQERDARLGVYGTVVEPGTIAVGDPVFLEFP